MACEVSGGESVANVILRREDKYMRRSNLIVIALVVLANLAVWGALNSPLDVPSWSGNIQGVSFSPYREGENPLTGKFPTKREIDSDLAVLPVGAVRTYSTTEGVQDVPGLAAKYGMRVTAGAWLDKRTELNELELQSLVSMVRRYPNIDRVLVGNEAILRADVTVPEMIQYLRRARSQIEVPVSTAEPWHVWLAHPELVKEVDYIAVHILPYWEGVPVEDAVKYIQFRYKQLKEEYPHKPVVLTEVGWPSKGRQLGLSQASLANQARFMREFLNFADREGVQYFLMEAFDQPWKEKIEGTAGAYWGLYDADRHAKYSFTGPVIENGYWPALALAASLLAFPAVLFFLYRWSALRFGGRLFFATLAQAAGSLLVWTILAGAERYMSLASTVLWSVMVTGQVGLLALFVTESGQMALMLWTKRWRREFKPLAAEPGVRLPKVSLHLPIYNEPPHMVIETVNSLAKLDYPNLEILVIDNNTKDPAVWKPIEAHCANLGERVRFIHVDRLEGFKAGALNLGLRECDPEAEIIGVIDSDYVVRADWLKATAPYFANGKVGVVQCPQDHRDGGESLFKKAINWEYAGFFNLGMVLRNESNAIIQHGTMTLVRRSLLEKLGGWAEWCICEDAELGLRVMHAGYETVYIKESFGHGLTPDSFAAYRVQRFRWAYGAMQIMKRHIRWFAPGARSLSPAQKFHFLAGWLPWLGDALQLLFTLAALAWTLFLALWPRWFEFPLTVFVVPALVMVGFKVVETLWLYKAKVNCGLGERIGAAIAGMALTHAVSKAVLTGLFTRKRPFLRTPKCEDKSAVIRGIVVAWEEFVLCTLLWLGAVVILIGDGTLGSGWRNQEAVTWATMLMALSLPYCAGVLASLASAMPTYAERRVAKPLPAPAPTVLLAGGIPATVAVKSAQDHQAIRIS
jgi:exo-beta-1,3-glucanase (GH17 family)/cellulose synthase/poly-beta-1,6-N-acetylglucosamine synthase-like glycosyltransferase